jgi:hypothetical protein
LIERLRVSLRGEVKEPVRLYSGNDPEDIFRFADIGFMQLDTLEMGIDIPCVGFRLDNPVHLRVLSSYNVIQKVTAGEAVDSGNEDFHAMRQRQCTRAISTRVSISLSEASAMFTKRLLSLADVRINPSEMVAGTEITAPRIGLLRPHSSWRGKNSVSL